LNHNTRRLLRICQSEHDAVNGLAETVETCTEIIRSAISDRIRQLGGTQRDVDELAQSAAFAVLAWSAGRTLGG
jgi:hypothetical protein